MHVYVGEVIAGTGFNFLNRGKMKRRKSPKFCVRI